MSSCERCWYEADRRGIDYREMLRIAEAECHPCCEPLNGESLTLAENARRLRAGQFWDEETKSDSRDHRSAALPAKANAKNADPSSLSEQHE